MGIRKLLERRPTGAGTVEVTTVDVSAGAGSAGKVVSLGAAGTLDPSMLPAATTSAPGSMSAADKTKLNAVSGTNTGDQTVAGSTGNLQYKGSGNALDATSGLSYTAGSTLLTTPNLAVTGTAAITANSVPSTPAAGTMALWGESVGGKIVPRFKGPGDVAQAVQASLASGKIGFWFPFGGGSTGPITGGSRYAALTVGGTATGRACAATNRLTRQLRLGIVSAASAGSLSSLRISGTTMTVGTGTAGIGGFYKIVRFGCSDAATVSGARQFVGISSTTSAPTDVEPSTLTNVVGVGHGAADTNLKIFYGGSAAQTAIDLGSSFPANTLTADLYELALYAPSNSATGDVYYQVTRLNTGATATGQLVGNGGTALPPSSTFLNYMWAYRSNNATALAVGLDFVSDYFEYDV